MDYISVIGFIAGTFTTVSFLPQVFKIYRTKQTRDLSLPMYVILFIGVILWVVYGVLSRSLPVIIANSVVIGLNLYILIMKVKYG